MTRFSLATAAALSLMAGAASAQTEITWWHAMGGALGETVNKIATDFNASQTDYKITPAFKGTYEETLTAGIAAFRAGQLHTTWDVPLAKIDAYKKDAPALLRVEPYIESYFFRFNTTHRLFSDVRLRRALSLARPEIRFRRRIDLR